MVKRTGFHSNSNHEYAGFVTSDGKFIYTQQQGSNGGQLNGLYRDPNTGITYYYYPTSQGTTAQVYAGTLVTPARTFIPIVATVHTHSPCVGDGTDGVSNRDVSEEDYFLAETFSSLRHFVIGCGAVGQFSGTGGSYFNIHSSSNINSICGYIH